MLTFYLIVSLDLIDWLGFSEKQQKQLNREKGGRVASFSPINYSNNSFTITNYCYLLISCWVK